MINVEVPWGGLSKLLLADGTKVWLNSGSVFTYPANFDVNKREVQLLGEGFFEVSSSDKPFIVKSNKCEVLVMGTIFNVKDYDHEPQTVVSLLEGSVKVRFDKAEKSDILLKPLKQVVFDGETIQEKSIENQDAFLWRDGYLVFDNTPFSEVMDATEKYFDVDIDVQNKTALSYHCTGKFLKSDGIDHLLKVLQKGADFNYKKKNNKIIIY
jgi:ferric-dicitrate binding protein FerR (iron transport regulator)